MASEPQQSPELIEQALRAAFILVSRGLLFLVPGRPDDAATEIGSATVVRSRLGHPAILTARHVVEDIGARPLRAGFPYCIGGAISDVAEEILAPPEKDIDVAIVVPKPHARASLDPVAISLDSVAQESDSDVGEGQWCVLGGYPFAYGLARKHHHERRIDQLFGSVTYSCRVEGRDEHGLLRVVWREAVLNEVDTIWGKFSKTRPGDTEELPDPHGMSGGVLWRFERAPRDRIWSPTSTGKVIGVQRGWYRAERTLVVEPTSRWRDWLNSALDEIDARLTANRS
jgi:hypothetical protein